MYFSNPSARAPLYIAHHFFFAAPAPALGFGIEAALILAFPLVSPLVAGGLLGAPAAFFGTPAPVVAGFLAVELAVGFFAAPVADRVPAAALLAVAGALAFFAGSCGLLLGGGLYVPALFMP